MTLLNELKWTRFGLFYKFLNYSACTQNLQNLKPNKFAKNTNFDTRNGSGVISKKLKLVFIKAKLTVVK